MDYVEKNIELSKKALDIKPFMDWFERPMVLGPQDQPHVAVVPAYSSMLDDAARITSQMREKAKESYEAGFFDRTQSGFMAFAGGPGLPETRPIVTTPEQAGGDIFSWLA